MRQAKINGTTNSESEGNTDNSAPPPPLPPSTSESEKAVNEVDTDELNEDGTPKKRKAPSIIPTTKTSAELSSAKRLSEAREMAKKEEARKKLQEQNETTLRHLKAQQIVFCSQNEGLVPRPQLSSKFSCINPL